MPDEGFLKRWSRLKAGGEPPAAPTPPVRPPAAPAPCALRPDATDLPTLEDVDRLTPASDFSAFVAQGVDKGVQRLALKKLFADPHFKVMDGLDMYMDDYNKPDPVSNAMLAALDHARGALGLPAQGDPQADRGEQVEAVEGAQAPVGATAANGTPAQALHGYTPLEESAGEPAGAHPPSSQGQA